MSVSFFHYEDCNKIVIYVFSLQFIYLMDFSDKISRYENHDTEVILFNEIHVSQYRAILKETFLIVSLRPIIFQNDLRRNFIPWRIATVCKGIGYDRNAHGNPFALVEFSNHRCNLVSRRVSSSLISLTL